MCCRITIFFVQQSDFTVIESSSHVPLPRVHYQVVQQNWNTIVLLIAFCIYIWKTKCKRWNGHLIRTLFEGERSYTLVYVTLSCQTGTRTQVRKDL
jgi:hypothetical protein